MFRRKDYLWRRYSRLKHFLRIRLGIQQLVCRPYLNALILAIVTLFALFWKRKGSLYAHMPKLILPIWRTIVHILGISIFIFLLVFIVYMIGELTARHDECALIVAFSASDLQKGSPIMIQKIRDKETGVTVTEFYSNTPYKRWQENKDEISDALNSHFVQPEIEYGGMRKDNGKRIILYTLKGRKPTKRGVMYDDE